MRFSSIVVYKTVRAGEGCDEKIKHVLVYLSVCLPLVALTASADSAKTQRGLNTAALGELSAAGVDKYLGKYTPTSAEDIGGGWTRHAFDIEEGEGPICIADNPFADHSIVYLPYCDGSAFGGDNDVTDQAFPSGPVRYHRGLRNQSAGVDLAGAMFPSAKQVTVMGHSAGGVGVAAFAPFLPRFVFGNNTKLTVFNDAGPIAVNLGTDSPPGNGEFPFGCADVPCLSVVARAADWQFAKFYPRSCIADGRCNPFGQQTGIIDWRLENDATIREAFYETDADATNRFFAQGDGFLMAPEVYRDLILTEHGALHDAYPDRYKRFIVSADDTHGGVQGTAPSPCFPYPQPFLFYSQDANGELLNEWMGEFIRIGNRQSQFGWKDIVEDRTAVDC